MRTIKELVKGDKVWVLDNFHNLTVATVNNNDFKDNHPYSWITTDYCGETPFRYSGTATRGYSDGDETISIFSDKEDLLMILENEVKYAELNLKIWKDLLEEFLNGNYE